MSAGLRYFVSPTEELDASAVNIGFVRHRQARRTSAWAAAAAVVATAAAVATAFLVSGSDATPWWAAGAATAILILEYATLPPYERARSLRAAKHLEVGAGVVLLLGTVTGLLGPAQVTAALLVVSAAALVVVVAALVRRAVHVRRPVVLVGDEHGVTDLLRQWGPRPDIEVRGVCVAQDPEGPRVSHVLDEPVFGGLGDVARVATATGAETVVVAPGRHLSAYDVRRIGWALERTPLELAVASEVHGATPHRVTSQVVGRRLLLSVRPGRRPAVAVLAKGVVDRVGAAVLLVLLSPVFVAVGLLVRLDSPGPVFFRQERSGRGDRRFSMIKFRTMCVDAEARLADLRDQNEAEGPLFKITADPRVTRLGRILRKTSLDELPQLVNVLKGEMSLIGPRPSLPRETEQYDDWESRRLAVKPGMTGAWQVGGRSKLGWQESIRLDLDYVDNWTLTDDLAIAAKTVRAVVQRDGAR